MLFLEELTIAQIAMRAGVGYATFFRHYPDKEALLVAVAAIAVYQYFGQTVRNQTAAIAQELSGKDGTAAKTAAQTASDKAKTVGDQKHTLDTYVNQVGK